VCMCGEIHSEKLHPEDTKILFEKSNQSSTLTLNATLNANSGAPLLGAMVL